MQHGPDRMNEAHFETERLRESTSHDQRTPKQQFESDRGRVVFSAPFRRLQRKAQVFSLESNAAVRSRLTHSMEVSHIGRYIAHKLSDEADRNDDTDFSGFCSMIEPLVETACLLHDIGNPPFGHLGESAIQEWFKKNAGMVFRESTGEEVDTSSARYQDYENFDGNPQGARIVLKLQGAPGKFGLNLTSAQIASIIKYPRFSDEDNTKYKKIAAFTSEREDIEKVWSTLGLKWGQRHPLVFLMEAADDIAYSLSDIEDGIEKKIVSEEAAISHLREEFKSLGTDLGSCFADESAANAVVSPFVSFRTSMINLLVVQAAKYFYAHRNEISTLGIKGIFEREDSYSKALKIVNEYCKNNLYQSQEAQDIEIAGYNIVFGLLDKFAILMMMKQEKFAKLVKEGKGKNLERRMFSKLPTSLVRHYEAAVATDSDSEWFIRFQLIVDYISGMTDDYALKLYRLLNGIEVSIV